MPVKRPPPLPKSLFTSGALAPGSAPLPPSPSTLHPTRIIDASYSPSSGKVNTSTSTPLFAVIPSSSSHLSSADIKSLPPLNQVTYTSPPPSAPELSTQPIQLNLPLDLKLITESQYDEFETFVAELSGVEGGGVQGLEGMMSGLGKEELGLGKGSAGVKKRDVVVGGSSAAFARLHRIQIS